MNDTVSVIIRTMPGRENYLNTCLFSLSCQVYRPIEVIVVSQTRNENRSIIFDQLYEMYHYNFQKLTLIEYHDKEDARSKSLNLGLNKSLGRYIGFLDDDDVLYFNHYHELVNVLIKNNNAWAYSDIVVARFDKKYDKEYLISRSLPFKRKRYSFIDHLRDNYIPINAFIIDRQRISEPLYFNEAFNKLEDYEFLLRLAIKYKPLYLSKVTCEYRIRMDGSNTVEDGTTDPVLLEIKNKSWEKAKLLLDRYKRELIGWWFEELLDDGALKRFPSGIIERFPLLRRYLILINRGINEIKHNGWKMFFNKVKGFLIMRGGMHR